MTLIEKVMRIDTEAAKWLIDNVDPERLTKNKSLSCAMTWDSTPQGSTYWKNIYNKINNSKLEMNRNGANS